MIKVLFFGPLAELAGSSSVELEAQPDVDSVLRMLQQRFPALREKTFRIALNQVLAEGQTPVIDGSVVALLPPFSGG